MTSNKRERDFFDTRGSHIKGRFDPRLLQNVEDSGDGMPGLQKATRNWTRYFFGSGVLDIDIDMNNHNLDSVGSIDGGGTGIQIYDNILLEDNELQNVSSIDGGGDTIYVNDSVDINGYLEVSTDVDVDGTFNVSGVSDFHSESDVNHNYIENITYTSLDEIDSPDKGSGIRIFIGKGGRLRFADNYGFEEKVGIRLGFFGGGWSSNVIQYINTDCEYIPKASDRGDLNNDKGFMGGAFGHTYGFFCAGTPGEGGAYDTIEQIDLTVTTGNSNDVGSISSEISDCGGVSGKTYGFVCGGYQWEPSEYLDRIEYINVTITTQNASDSGDLTVARSRLEGVYGRVYGFIGGGWDGSNAYNVIDYINVTNATGNASDSGDLITDIHSLCGVSGRRFGFFCGGYSGGASNVIQYIDITTTTGNATDSGDLTQGRRGTAGCEGNVYGFVAGGYYSGGDETDRIDFINLETSTGNASNKGTLLADEHNMCGIGS